MRPSRNTGGIVLLIAGVLIALAATRRSRRGLGSPSRIGLVAGVALALIGLRRLLRSRQAWQSDFDAQHDDGWGGNWSGFDLGGPSLRRHVERAAGSVRREFEKASRVFG